VEKELLEKPDAVVLDYEDGLVLHVNTDSIDWLTGKVYFKSRIGHKVDHIDGKRIIFRDDLTYIDYLKVDELLRKKVPAAGYDYISTDRLQNYISSRNLYIEKRSTLGIELKTDDSRLEDRYEKFRSIVETHMERKLRDKQMRDAFFMFAMMRAGNFSVPGSGKTSSALAVYAFLKTNGIVKRIVMIGPKNSFGSWIDEFKACFGVKEELKVFNVQDSEYRTTAEKKLRLKYETENCNLFLFNYESVENYIEELSRIVSEQTLLVFDEAHKVKAINGQRASAALKIAENGTYIIAMTGTPIPNSYLDIYNLLHILYNNEYKEFFGFEVAFLRNPLPTEIDLINQRIQPFFCRTTKQELNVPEPNPDIVLPERVTDIEQQVFEILTKKYRNNQLALFIRILQLESNPKMLLEALDLNAFSSILDITDNIDGIDFVDYSNEIKELINGIAVTTKKKSCIDQVKKLVAEGKRAIVWCIFKDSIRSITTLLEAAGIKARFIMGEVELEDRLKLIDQFKTGAFDVLVTNPHTLGESVSLHTVCHDAVYFEYSYNLVHLLQSKDRIHRLGLPQEQYTQYYFLQNVFDVDGEDYSMDNNVYLRLLEKERIMLDAIDNQKLEPVYTPEEDLKIIFKGLL